VFGIISRFAHQKGFSLLREALPGGAQQYGHASAPCSATGMRTRKIFFRWLSATYPGRVGAHIGFSVDLSHLIEAGSDFFLMPSLYEPAA